MVEIYINDQNNDDHKDNQDSLVECNNSEDNDGEGDDGEGNDSDSRWNYLLRRQWRWIDYSLLQFSQYQIIVGSIYC